MTLPDNRLRFPPALIDFATDVGSTNTDIDSYPPPQGQARYDHMRMAILGLLTQQSSYDEPTIMSDGTPWFDLNTNTLKIRSSGEWVDYSDTISLGVVDTDNNQITLSQWFDATNTALSGLAQEVIFNGISAANNVTDITIPESLQHFIYTDTRCFLYVNGLLIDPRNCVFVGTTTIRLSNISLDTGDTFTAIFRRVPSDSFYAPTVSVS